MPCPICFCPGSTTFFTKSDRRLLICRDCRHIWWDSFPSLEQLRDYYRLQYTSAHAQESLQSSVRDYYRGHLRDLLHLVGKSAAQCRILDYGCSIPVLLMEAAELQFAQAIGVDYAEEAQAHAAGRRFEVIQPDQVECLPDGSLDVIRFSHTLEHSTDPVSILSTIFPKLCPGGLLYITQPNFPVFRFGASAHDLKDTVYPEHLHFFSPLSLVEMVRRFHLQVHRFFTHQNEQGVFAQFRDMLDVEHAEARLEQYQAKGDSFYPALANYPYYTGENSVLYAFKCR